MCLSIQQRSLKWAPIYVTIFVLHPVWWFGLDGFLGDLSRLMWVGTSLVLAAILVAQLFRPGLGRGRFIFSLCIVTWMTLFIASLTRAVSSPEIEGGLMSQLISALALSECHLSTTALALTLLTVLQGPAHRFWIKYVLKTEPRNEQQADSLQARAASRLPTINSRKARLRFFFAIVLLGLLAYVIAMPKLILRNGDHDALTAFFGAVGWVVILLIALIRGEFPGWREAGRLA